MLVESQGCEAAGVLLLVSFLAAQLSLSWGFAIGHPLADTEQERVLCLGF